MACCQFPRSPYRRAHASPFFGKFESSTGGIPPKKPGCLACCSKKTRLEIKSTSLGFQRAKIKTRALAGGATPPHRGPRPAPLPRRSAGGSRGRVRLTQRQPGTSAVEVSFLPALQGTLLLFFIFVPGSFSATQLVFFSHHRNRCCRRRGRPPASHHDVPLLLPCRLAWCRRGPAFP